MNKTIKMFVELIKKQDSFKILKGKFPSFQSYNNIDEIEQVLMFDSNKKHFPYVFFQGNSSCYLGITLARQSSDFLSLIAKKLLKLMKNDQYSEIDNEISIKKVNLIQYRFPKDINSLNLILFLRWEDIDQFEMILSFLDNIQRKFEKAIKNIVDKNVL